MYHLPSLMSWHNAILLNIWKILVCCWHVDYLFFKALLYCNRQILHHKKYNLNSLPTPTLPLVVPPLFITLVSFPITPVYSTHPQTTSHIFFSYHSPLLFPESLSSVFALVKAKWKKTTLWIPLLFCHVSMMMLQSEPWYCSSFKWSQEN